MNAALPLIVFDNAREPLAPLLLDSPHSGTVYPDDFNFSCPLNWLRQTEDAFVDELLSAAPRYGIGLLKARFARAYIDVNRAETDIDPRILDGEWAGPLSPTERSIAGHGLMRHLCRSQPVYAGKIPAENAKARIDSCYRPYHARLENELHALRHRFGAVWHINCHSMPSGAGQPALAALYPQSDFILGDRDGTSCEKAFTAFISQSLKNMGYRVGHNDPYKGVEVIGRHGKPQQGMHSLQLEINRALYMDELSLQPHAGYAALQANLNQLLVELRGWLEGRLMPQSAAAE